jgi:hypothetical protein
MTRQIISILFIFNSCINPESKRTSEIKSNDSATVKKADTTTITKDTLHIQSQSIDSIDQEDIQKLTINKSDSSIWLTANMKLDHRIFGYEKPDVNSRKLILISIFTNDVEGNPYKCPLGSYYQTSDMKNMELKYAKTTGDFVEAIVIKDSKAESKVYFEKKWVEFLD